MKVGKCVLLVMIVMSFGQTAQAQVRIFGGPQLVSAKYHIRNVKQDYSFKASFMAGLNLQYQLEGPFYFSPLLYYSQKGYKVTFNQKAVPPDTAALNNDTRINTIVLAPLFQFNLSAAESHWFVRFGPGFDFNVSGQEVFDSTGGKQVDRAMSFSSLAYSPATAFAAIQVGYEHENGLILFAHYEHGLSNLNNADLGPMILHRVAGVSVGWKLGRKK